MDGGGVVELHIGGWVAMPPDHWDIVKKQLEKHQQENPQAPHEQQ